jgi:hypothetical protein
MNDRIDTEFDKFFNKIKSKLPENLSHRQFQELAIYAYNKLQEEKLKTKIIFNPEETTTGMTQQPAKSDANASHQKYRLSNKRRK